MAAVACPIGERRHGAGQFAVAVGIGQLAMPPRNPSLLEFDRAVAQHQMGKVDIELVRRHIRAFGQKAHIAQRARIGDLLVIGRDHAIDLAGFGIIDQIEQPGKRVAQIEAPPAGVADVKNPLHLCFGLRPIGEIGILPRDHVPGRGLQAAFSHQSSRIAVIG